MVLGLRHARVLDPLPAQIITISVGKGRPDELRHRFGENAEARFTFPERLFGAALVGDILAGAENADDPALLVAQPGVPPSDDPLGPVGSQHDTFGARFGMFVPPQTPLGVLGGGRS